MKQFFCVVALCGTAALNATPGQWTGYIADSACTKKMSASTTASAGHADCAKRCIKGGSPAVLVTSDGKVYSIANTDKVIDYAGQKVALEGDLNGDTIHVSKIKP